MAHQLRALAVLAEDSVTHNCPSLQFQNTQFRDVCEKTHTHKVYKTNKWEKGDTEGRYQVSIFSFLPV